MRGRTVAALAALLLIAGWCAAANAEQPRREPVDPTRLDVERLPPEAIEITRDMFSRGLLVGATVGGRGLVGGAGRYVDAGPMLSVSVGYELTVWLALSAVAEVSLHRTAAPTPPTPGTFELIDALAELRLTLPLDARAALWIAPQGGVGWATGDLLPVYGLQDADAPGLVYGGSLGFDWHLMSRHHALGLQVGTRLHPNLDDPTTERALAVHGSAYLKYVF
ncbi:MAG: hypothetical protein PVI30_23990 [Myxococcales bacterium]